MKKTIIILLCGIVLGGVLFAQNRSSRRNAVQQQEAAQAQRSTGPQMSFETSVHDFGTVREEAGRISTHFEFTNTGTAPVIILRIGTGCPGCTFASYTREPILPGQNSKITIEYATTGRPGAFNRPVTVHTNVPDTVFTLFIRGTVAPRQQ